ncbi:MAG: PfkB family carbohydrate kinase [Nanoarchaeota archaeon]|nr:PfkB family carbohydrate kinase [Nanoarchaeota archaeon]
MAPDLVILGTIGIDTLKTPFGTADSVLGGSSMYASAAASFFARPGVLSVKGTDLAEKELAFLKEKGVLLEGIQTQGKNFRWSGEYTFDMNAAKTLKTELNSLAEFKPTVPLSYKEASFLFLANMDPDVQLSVLKQTRPKCVMLDTMNFWIEHKRKPLLEAIKQSNILICNDGEARELFQTPNLVQAAHKALELGVEAVIIKKGEHGSLLFGKEGFFSCPGYPLESIRDPTGCGDTFGGAFLSHYAKHGNMRKAMVYGAVLASFTAEGFGMERLKQVTRKEIETRFSEMKKFGEF